MKTQKKKKSIQKAGSSRPLSYHEDPIPKKYNEINNNLQQQQQIQIQQQQIQELQEQQQQ